MTVVGTIMVSIAASLLAAELFGWTSAAGKWLIRLAVSCLPVQHRKRYRDEWFAEYASLRDSGPLRKLWFAITVFLNSRSTSRVVERVPRTIAGRDLIWGTPDAEMQERAYAQAVRELAAGDLTADDDEAEDKYREQWIRRVHLPPETWGKHGEIEIAPGAWVDVAPLTFNCLVRIWKRILLRGDEK